MELTTTNQKHDLMILSQLGQAANQAAADSTFSEYANRKAANSIRRHKAGLALFSDFLQSRGAAVGDLATDPAAWNGITWGLVKAFQNWMILEGYAVSTANQRLSTVKVYAKLAMKAGTLAAGDYALIKALEGYQRREAIELDCKREDNGISTRRGHKKAAWISISKEQARALKNQPNTPQGRRDRLMFCLLLDHGLRCGEVAGLQVSDFDLKTGELHFYRPKVHKTQTHRMSKDTAAAAAAYLENDALAIGPLLRGSNKAGVLGAAGLSEQAITARVRHLGAAMGIETLSAHDCRHYWATQAARNKTPLDRLQDAGGWASTAMPMRYIETAKIANEGVILGAD